MKQAIPLIIILLGVVCGIAFLPYSNWYPSALLAQKGRCIRIPVLFSPFPDKPLVEIEIENRKYVVLFDSGSSFAVSLKSKALKTIKNKKPISDLIVGDMKGNRYVCPSFKISALNLGSTQIQEPIVVKQNKDFTTRGS